MVSVDSADIWSRYSKIFDFCRSPIRSLINIVGGPKDIQVDLQAIIQEVLHDNKPNQPPYRCPQTFRIQTYDMPATCPRRRAPPTFDHRDCIKASFFSNVGYYKPAVTIFVFDYRERKTDESWDWTEIEKDVLAQVKVHSQNWQTGLSVHSKYIVIFLLPKVQSSYYNIDQCRAQFHQTVRQTQEEHIKTNNYFLPNGLENLRNNKNRNFAKTIQDLVYQYYKEKKEVVKRKQQRRPPGSSQTRYYLKHTLYSLITSQNYEKCIKLLEECYTEIKRQTPTKKIASLIETRDNADIIALLQMQFTLNMHTQQTRPEAFVNIFRSHFYTFKIDLYKFSAQRKWEEIKWRANWFNIVGSMLEQHY